MGAISKWRRVVGLTVVIASVATTVSWTISLLVVFLLGAAEQTVARKQLTRWSRPWMIAVTYEVAWCVAAVSAALIRLGSHGLAWLLVILAAAISVDLTYRGVMRAMRYHSRSSQEVVARPLAWLMGACAIWVIMAILGMGGPFLAWLPALIITALVPLTALRAPELTAWIRKFLTIEGFGAPGSPKGGLTDVFDRYAAAFLVGGCVLFILHVGGVAL